MSETDLAVGLVDWLLAAELREQMQDGAYIRPLANVPCVTYSWLLTYCRRRGIRSKNCHHSRVTKRIALQAVIRDGLPIRQAARQAGMSRSGVHRLVSAKRDSIVSRVDSVGFRTVPVYRCPEHGLTTIKPCPACLAMQARNQ